MQDTVYAGTIAGTLGGVVILAVNLVPYGLGIAKATILHAAAAIILPGNIALITPPRSPFGSGHTLAAGSLFRRFRVYIRASGRGYTWLKGTGYGGFLWLLTYSHGVGTEVPGWLQRPDLATCVSMLAAYLSYGLTVWFVLTRYGTEAV